jgi:hypothetical protein
MEKIKIKKNTLETAKKVHKEVLNNDMIIDLERKEGKGKTLILKSEHQKKKEKLRAIRSKLKKDLQERRHILDKLIGEKPEILEDDDRD